MQTFVDTKEILDRLTASEDSWTVNDDPALTERTKARIAGTDWGRLAQEANRTDETDTPFALRNSVYIARLYESKDITPKIPVATRFRFVKRVINKLMKVSTNYQETYNNASYELFNSLITAVTLQEREIKVLRHRVDELEACLSENKPASDR